MHLFYRERVTDVADALPKYLDGWDGPLHVSPGHQQLHLWIMHPAQLLLVDLAHAGALDGIHETDAFRNRIA